MAIRPLGAIVVGSGWIGCSVRVSGDRVTIQPMIPGMREILAWIALVCAVGAGIVAWFLVLAPRCERVQRELERLLRRELGARTER